MKKQLIALIMVLLLIIIGFSGCLEEKDTNENNDANSQNTVLEFDISINDSYLAGEPIIVTATLTNMGSEPVDISTMGLEVDTLDFYITTPDGKNLQYIGPIVFYCPDITILTTEQMSIEVDLEKHWTLTILQFLENMK